MSKQTKNMKRKFKLKNYTLSSLLYRRLKNNYNRWRGYVDPFLMKELNEELKMITAMWFNSKHIEIPFTDMFIFCGKLYLYTERPGLWIGKGGSTIEDYAKYINDNIDYYKKLDIQIIEDLHSANVLIKQYRMVINSNY